MRTRIKKTNNLIKLDDNFVSIVAINNLGQYVYRFTYYADAARCLNNNAINVKISVMKTRPPVHSMFSSRSQVSLTKSILTHRSRLRDQVREQAENIIYSISTDISSAISNPSAKKLSIASGRNNDVQGKRKIIFSDKQGKTGITEVSNRYVRIIKDVHIDRSSVSSESNFFVALDVVDKSGKKVSRVESTVKNSDLVSKFNETNLPPLINVTQVSTSENRIKIEQRDPRATSVRIYRRLIKLQDPSIDGSYKVILDKDLLKSDGIFSFVDTVNNTSIVSYRAVSVGPTGQLGQGFSTAVSKSKFSGNNISSRRSTRSHISVFAKNVSSGVELRVSNIPSSAVSIDLLAKKSDEISNSRFRLVSGNIRVNQSNGDVTVVDKDVKDGKRYEYRARIKFAKDSDVISEPEYHEFRKLQEKNIVLNITNPVSSQESISFDIEFDFTEQGFNGIVSSVAGIGSEATDAFFDEIKKDRSNFSSLVKFLVERQDSTSGKTESFGVFDAGTFTDSPTQRKKSSVQPITLGNSYRYVVTPLIRAADTLFDSVELTGIDQSSLQRFKFRARKFLDPSSIRHGTIPSNALIDGVTKGSGLDMSDPFIRGRTGLSESVDISVPSEPIPTIESLSIKIDSTRVRILSWKVTGDSSTIDHFMVFARHAGINTPVGTVHALTNDNVFSFTDDAVTNSVGKIEYFVQPIMSNFTKGNLYGPVETNIQPDIPRFQLKEIENFTFSKSKEINLSVQLNSHKNTSPKTEKMLSDSYYRNEHESGEIDAFIPNEELTPDDLLKILDEGIDPADVFNAEFPLQSVKNSFSGTKNGNPEKVLGNQASNNYSDTVSYKDEISNKKEEIRKIRSSKSSQINKNPKLQKYIRSMTKIDDPRSKDFSGNKK